MREGSTLVEVRPYKFGTESPEWANTFIPKVIKRFVKRTDHSNKKHMLCPEAHQRNACCVLALCSLFCMSICSADLRTRATFSTISDKSLAVNQIFLNAILDKISCFARLRRRMATECST